MKYIISDIDNTIADCSHRLHHIEKEPKDWESFFFLVLLDDLMEETLDKIDEELKNQIKIQNTSVLFVTGRPERIRNHTERWLRSFGIYFREELLLMRPDGDHRPAEVVKLEKVAEAGIKPEDILCVFDDDEKVCQAWKELGVTVYKVL